MCDRVFKVPYIIASHLDKDVFSFDIHILIKKMLLTCMESLKKLSKQCSHMANSNLGLWTAGCHSDRLCGTGGEESR